ncbi:MAG: hypothetical protein ACM37Z_11195 [Deltaproteobacteria bacterium]
MAENLSLRELIDKRFSRVLQKERAFIEARALGADSANATRLASWMVYDADHSLGFSTGGEAMGWV